MGGAIHQRRNAMKKRTRKGTTVGKRQAKDLSPRRSRDVKGGLESSVQKKLNETQSAIQQKMG
jgi:hypothetical protein